MTSIREKKISANISGIFTVKYKMSKLEEFERKLYKRGEVESQKRDSFKAGEESLIATKHEWERERGKESGLSGRAKKILAVLFFLFLAAIFLSARASVF